MCLYILTCSVFFIFQEPFTNAMTVALTFDTPNISRAFLSGLEPETLYKVAISGYSRQGFGEVYYMTALTLEDSLRMKDILHY